MIIFGTRGITTTPERGTFNCPQCASPQAYNFKRVRRFFTLYFIPLIPLDKLGEYVECPRCQGTYDPDILNYDPANEALQVEAFYFIAIKQVMIAMLLADGVIDDNEVLALQSIYRDLTGTEIPEQELREEIAVISGAGSTAVQLVAEVGPQLNDSGKEMVIRAAYSIAQADGVIDESETKLIGELGGALGFSNAHLNAVLVEASEEKPALEG